MRQAIDVDGQVDRIHVGQPVFQLRQALRQFEHAEFVVAHVVHAQRVGGVEQHARVGGGADAVGQVLQREARRARMLDRLQERRAGAGLVLPAQVEMGVDVDDGHPRPARAQMPCQAKVAGEGDLVAAAQSHCQVAGVQQRCHRLGIARLRGFQITVGAGHGAGVVERRLVQHRQVGQHPAQRRRAFHRTHAAVVAAHAFVAGEAQHRDPRRTARERRAHPLVPAPGRRILGQVDAAAPAFNGAHAGNSQAVTGYMADS